MRVRRTILFLALLATVTCPALAQEQPSNETLSIASDKAATWSQDQTNVIQLDGTVEIDLDRVHMTAKQAVIWITPLRGEVFDQQQAEISLIGNAVLKQDGILRSGNELFVNATIRGPIRITANERFARNLADSKLYQQADAIRPGLGGIARQTTTAQRPWIAPETAPATTPSTQPLARPAVKPPAPIRFRAPNVEVARSNDGTLAVILSGGILVFQTADSNNFMEMRAASAVLLTTLTSAEDARKVIAQSKQFQASAITGAYLEGDVRVVFSSPQGGTGEQRLEANRVFYDFRTQRAILTDAVLHTLDPSSQIPITLRAETIRQLSRSATSSEYKATNAQLSTSSFATPSYSIAADKIYLHRSETDSNRYQDTFSATDVTFNLFGYPFFYLPRAGGAVTENGIPLRRAQIGNSSRYGFGVQSEWGLMETLGFPPARDLDLSYRADYFGSRGPATGLNARYSGGFVTETTREPWNFRGALRSYFVDDHGTDKFGSDRTDVEPSQELRGRALWQHQHFFPEDWQVQLQGAWVSDPTFMEEWFPREWENSRPLDESFYVKKQHDTEAFTFLASFQPNHFVTTSDLAQEQFEVERMPELGYHRIGDSFADDTMTFFSDNTVSRLHFQSSNASLAEQGYGPGLSPGIPSLGTTGVTNDYVTRGDFRQEIDYPLSTGRIKTVPYVMGRYTPYSDSPTGDPQNRIFAGTGVRMLTDFWKVDDSAQSELFDIHRLRHIIEPEVNVFTSASSVNHSDVFIYDEPVDAINDITALQLALHQRWQTKRGGPGNWRSVDFFTLNIAGNFFSNQPEDQFLNPHVGPEAAPFYDATGFRGLYFPSLPEASIPRNSINADQLWRVSDTTSILADQQYNLDEQNLATASLGLASQHDPRVTYYLGFRYIEPVDSDIVIASIYYQLSTKYTVAFSQAYDLGANQDVSNSTMIIRKFDRFFAVLDISYDQTTGMSSYSINISPDGVPFNPLGWSPTSRNR